MPIFTNFIKKYSLQKFEIRIGCSYEVNEILIVNMYIFWAENKSRISTVIRILYFKPFLKAITYLQVFYFSIFNSYGFGEFYDKLNFSSFTTLVLGLSALACSGVWNWILLLKVTFIIFGNLAVAWFRRSNQSLLITA